MIVTAQILKERFLKVAEEMVRKGEVTFPKWPLPGTDADTSHKISHRIEVIAIALLPGKINGGQIGYCQLPLQAADLLDQLRISSRQGMRLVHDKVADLA